MEEGCAPVEDRLDPARAAALWKVLGRDGVSPNTGEVLPALFHHVYFWPDPTAVDGSGKVVGGKLRVHVPVRFGIAADLQTMPGPADARSVAIRQRGVIALSHDEHLAPIGGWGPAPARQHTPQARVHVRFGPEALFAFAALTLNGQRLHFDAAAAGGHGLSAPLVDARLLALHLASMAEDRLGPLQAFDYRAFAPVLQDQPVALCTQDRDFWIEDGAGGVVMTARAG